MTELTDYDKFVLNELIPNYKYLSTENKQQEIAKYLSNADNEELRDLNKKYKEHKKEQKELENVHKIAKNFDKAIKDLKIDDIKKITNVNDNAETIVEKTIEDGEEKVKIIRRERKYDDLREPMYTDLQVKHKRYHDPKVKREDLSNLVKDVIRDDDFKLGMFVRGAGGKRKLFKCPHCDGIMMVTGVKGTKERADKTLTAGQMDWQKYVKAVSQIPEYKGIGRSKVLVAAGKLKKEGVTLDDIKEKLLNIN